MPNHEDQAMQESMEAVEQLEEQVQPEEQQQEQIQASESNASNIRRLREEKERLARENEEYRKFYEQQMKQAQPQQQEDDDDFGISPDDFVEGKHLKKYYKEIKQMRKDFKAQQEQIMYQTTEARLKSQFPDFEKVVNEQTVQRLREEYPEIADTLNESTNMYSKAAAAYKVIRNMGIYQDPGSQADRQRVYNNTSKPRPANALNGQQSGTPLSRANAFSEGLTPELKRQLLEEMENSRRG